MWSQQGVSINIFIKNKGIKKSIQHFDLFGKREFKYEFLNSNNLNSINWNSIKSDNENCFFTSKDLSTDKGYLKYISIADLMPLSNSGIQTKRDAVNIHFNKNDAQNVLNDFKLLNVDEIKKKYDLPEDGRDWTIEFAKKDIQNDVIIHKEQYRPFDYRFSFYTGKSKGIVAYPRQIVSKHIIGQKNDCICLMRQFFQDANFSHILYTNKMVDERTMYSNRGGTYIFPLYLYPETTGQQIIGQSTERTPNLNTEIVKEIADKLGLTFVPEKFPSSGGVAESRGGESTGFVAESLGRRNTKNYMDLPYNPNLKERAKELRQAGNLSEVLFWNQVKNKQFKGFDFDRQKIVGNYIVDFYCSNCNVVIEIDGSSHDDKQEYDAARDSFLESLGLTVIHIPVVDVMKKMNGVMKMLFNHPALEGTPPSEGNFAPIDILDYIYAVLHSPTYREKYKEFLKIDFPRVPYPKDKDTFWQLVKLGGQIREIHLLESPTVEKYITQYPKDGDNVVVKPKYENGKVYINDTQYFDNVPQVAWEFYIGGYQPAQKWLKDRKDRKLEFDDILHYQKIIVALTETDRLMKEIDKLNIE
jgi:very-short-patch-repair endonuclease